MMGENDGEINRAASEIIVGVANEEFFAFLESYGDDQQRCVVCGGIADIAWDYDVEGGRFADLEFCSVAHTPECVVGRASRWVKERKKDGTD